MINALITYGVLFVLIGMTDRNLLSRIFNILVSFDQFVWVVITFGRGNPDETISSATYRYEQRGNWGAKIARPVIDWLFSWYEDDHCYKAYLAEINRSHSF